MATGDSETLDRAVALYELIEKHSFDSVHGGYYEAFTREWGEIADLRLSEKDENEKKTMNTHLHVLEAYTSLLRIWPDEGLKRQLGSLVRIFTDTIVDAGTGHLGLFFDEEWNCRSTAVSYGHDIEASWLLCEAAEALGEAESVKGTALRIASAAHEGLAGDGSLFYERDDARGHFDRDRHWWVQSEAVVGFVNAWKMSGDHSWLELAAAAWQYITANLVDRVNGEWFWSIRDDGSVNRDDDKAGFWKCPYHNTRMCLEIATRYNK
jgi:mannobiose 2-epimerase